MGGVFGFFLFFICFFFVCFINLFDSYLFLNINMYFSSCSCLRFFIHHFIYFTSAKHHPTRPALLMPKPEVIICTSRHHIPSPMELKFSMNHPIFQVNHIMFTSVFVLTVYIIWPFCQYYLQKVSIDLLQNHSYPWGIFGVYQFLMVMGI